MKNPHVLVLPSWLDCKWAGGGSFFVEQAAIMRQIAGWQIRMLAPFAHHVTKIIRQKLPYINGTETFTREGVEITCGYKPYFLPRSSAQTKIRFGEKLFLEYTAKHGKPDYFWVQSISHAGFLAQYLSHKYNVPYFIHEHVAKYDAKKLSASTAKKHALVVNNAVYCAAVSERLREAMLSQLTVDKRAICVVHNPVGMVFSDAPPAPRRQNPFVFISTAFLREDKNIDLIIRAFSEVHGEHPNSELLLVGGGAMRNTLEDLTRELGLAGAVKFTGEQSREQVCGHLRSADAFVAASDYETFGVALTEALMCGLPAITPPVGIASKAAGDNNGVILEATTAAAIAAAMQKVMQADYSAAAIQQAARLQFSPQLFAQRIQENLSLQ